LGQSTCWQRTRVAVLLCAGAIASPAQTFTTLASFSGVFPFPNGLIQGADGNLYGSTVDGGTVSCPNIFGLPQSCGTIFKVTPAGTLTTLYNFGSAVSDGAHPSSLIPGADGNLYGTTSQGGTSNNGAIFRITSAGALTTLYSFGGSGGSPNSLMQATDGNFYGTTNNVGTVFKFTPAGTLTTLHVFQGPEGSVPAGGLVQGSDGNLYGMTEFGGTGPCQSSLPADKGCGTIFRITPAGSLTTIYSFQVTDGANPVNSLIRATDGNFYGTTEFGGSGACANQNQDLPNNGCGTIFKITPAGTLTTLYNFGSLVTGGVLSNGVGLIQAKDGNFYGTTNYGGIPRCGSAFGLGCGTIFKFTPPGTLTTQGSFGAGDTDGLDPVSIMQAADGNFYGTTYTGGVGSIGVVFRFTLPSPDLPAIAGNGGVVNGASFLAGTAGNSWITIRGANLSPKTDTWDNAIVNGNLPVALDGVSVTVEGQPAYVEYVSPTQINALIPGFPALPLTVSVTTPVGTSAPVFAIAQTAQPAFFQWGSYAVATTLDYRPAVRNGTIAEASAPARPGDVIILWGTGFGPTNPPAPNGVEVPANTTYNTVNPVTVTVGSQPATVYGAALAPGFAGLYQVAIQIPASLANGDYPVIASVAGFQSPSTTLISVQN